MNTNIKVIFILICIILCFVLVLAGVIQLVRFFADESPSGTGNSTNDDTSSAGNNSANGEDRPSDSKGLSKAQAKELASNMVTFGGFEELDADASRWIFDANREIIDELEASGYNVSIGTMFCLKVNDGNVVNTNSPSLSFAQDGFTPLTTNTSCTLIYNTDGRYSPSNLFISTTESTYTFTYKILGLSTQEKTFVVECRAFVCLDYEIFAYENGGEKTLVGANAKLELSEEEAQAIADAMIAFHNYEVVDSDSARWIFKVNVDMLNKLERAGYNVSFGAAVTLLTNGGETYNTTDALVQCSAEGGFTPLAARGAACVLVHNTDGTHSPSNLYTTIEEGYQYFTYKMNDLMSTRETLSISARAFVALNYGMVQYSDGYQATIDVHNGINMSMAMGMAETVLSFESFERVNEDSARWIFEVDEAAVAMLENANYNVTYGAIVTMLETPSQGFVNTTVSNVYVTDTGELKNKLGNSLHVVVYSTNGKFSPTNKYVTVDGKLCFSYLMNGLSGTDGIYRLGVRFFVMVGEQDIYHSKPDIRQISTGSALTEEEAFAVAEDMISFDSFELTADGGRWVYRVSKEKLAMLETAGNAVTFGGVVSVRSVDGEVKNTEEPKVLFSPENMTFESTLSSNNQVKLVYGTPGSLCTDKCSNLFLEREDDTYKYFSLTVTGMSTQSSTFEIEAVAFVNLSYADNTFYDNGGMRTFVGGALS